MKIDEEKCVGCMLCFPYCPHSAISLKSTKKATVDHEKCTECFTCRRSYVCPTDAITEEDLTWPRSVRLAFGTVLRLHKDTGIPGRGTEEMKTNDVTGRFQNDEAGFSIDVGRPGVGTTLGDVEKISMEVAKVGVEFEPLNPVTFLMSDPKNGKLRDDVKSERIHSCVLEFKTKVDKVPEVVKALDRAAAKVETVFSTGCVGRILPNGTIPIRKQLEKNKISFRPNGKTNMGLGKPAASFGDK